MDLLELNPVDEPIVETHFYNWLHEGGYDDYRMVSIKEYFTEMDGERTYLSEEELTALTHIYDYYVGTVIYPPLVNIVEEKKSFTDYFTEYWNTPDDPY